MSRTPSQTNRDMEHIEVRPDDMSGRSLSGRLSKSSSKESGSSARSQKAVPDGQTVEEQLRDKFLSAGNTSESTKKSSIRKIGFSEPPKMVAVTKKVVQMNEGANKFRKTVKMDFATVEISDSASDYSDSESDNSEARRQRSKKSAFNRRPSVNPALLNLSSSSSETMSDDDEEEVSGIYDSKRFSRSPSTDGEDEEDFEFRRMLRKTLISRRKTFSDIRQSLTSNKSKIGDPNQGLKRFQAAAKTIAIGQQFIKAATDNFNENLSEENQKTKESALENDTIELPPINQTLFHARRDGFNPDKFAEQKLRNQLEMLMEGNETPSWVIHPYSKFRFKWDILTVIIILCNVITIPLEFSFYDGNSDLHYLNLLTDAWFTIDMMLTFRTGFVNSDASARKNVNMDPGDIRRSYVRSWLIIDFLATFPFDMIFQRAAGPVTGDIQSVESVATFMKVTRILKILKLMRLFRLGRFVRYLHHWEEVLSMDYGTGENAIKGLIWLCTMLFMCHWNACILYLVPTVSESPSGKPPGNETAFGPKDSYGYSWYYIEGFHMESKTRMQKYFWCLFKSMSHMLTIGYGVNTPVVMSDVWTSIFVMFVGALTFALFLSQLISMVDQLKITATIYKRHIRQVDDYLKFNRCPKNIKQAVKEFYDFHYRQRIFDEERIFSELNPILLDEITTCGIIEYIEECDLFQSCRADLQRHLCQLFKVEMFQPYTNIILSGRMANKFSIIRQGVITVEADNARRGHYYHLEEGDSFGLESFANVTNPRYVTTALSETWVEIIQMDIKKFVEFGRANPEYREDLKLIDTIANQQLRQSGHFAQIVTRQREIKMYFG